MARKFSLAQGPVAARCWRKSAASSPPLRQGHHLADAGPARAGQDQLTVSRKELDEAYESEFGPAVKVRLIAHRQRREGPPGACPGRGQARGVSGRWPRSIRKDTNSASAYGLIQPIRRHLGDPKLEEAAFALKKGEISKIVQVGELYVFVKCEEHLPPTKGVDRAKVEPHADRRA